jgi:PilZ domain
MMRKFVYRAPRFPVDLLVQISFEELTVMARCREISKDGMVLEALKNPLPKRIGIVRVSHKGMTVELDARVARSGSKVDGLQFIFKSDAERKEMAQFVASLAETRNKPGPQLIG